MGPQGLSSGRLLEPRYVTLTRVPLSRGSAEASPTPPAGPRPAGEIFQFRIGINTHGGRAIPSTESK